MDEIIPPKRNLPRDLFLHLFAIVALYWSAISFITLCWQYVNYFFPDINVLRYGGQSYGPIRFAVASLVIVFPLFILATWYLNKIYHKESIVRESRIRKWLIYLTLFIASLVIIGDLVIVIFNFLGGDVTAKFLLKALSVLVVAAAIFGYYLDDVRRPQPSKSARYYAWGTGVVILALVIGAFFIVGSPKSARLVQLDQQRISDLQSIQYQVVYYWQRKQVLPQSLTDLNDPLGNYFIPSDPETNQSYEYTITDANARKFELCANFSLEGGQNTMAPKAVPTFPNVDYFQTSWDHGKGRTCFERQIDPQLYPPIPAK